MNFKPLITFYEYMYDLTLPKLTLKQFVKNIFYQKWIFNNLESYDVLLFQSLQRDDYNNFVNTILKTLTTEKKLLEKPKQNRSFNLDIFSLPIKEVIQLINSLKNQKKFERKLYIFQQILILLKCFKYLKNSSPKLVIVHADMQPIENVIVQYFKSKNIPTVTLQHGLYIDYTNEPNINAVNYLNTASQYFLSWGEDTKKLIEKYHPQSNIKVLGNPNIIQKTFEKSGFFVVVFEHEGNKKFNHILLSFARKVSSHFNLPLKVKLHPRNVFKEYHISRDEVVKHDNVYNANFAIGHTSTMLYELLRNDIPIFKLLSDKPSNHTPDILTFSNEKELIYNIENIHNINASNLGQYYIKYTQDEALKQYQKFFDEILLKA